MTSHFPHDPDDDRIDARGLGVEEMASAMRAAAAGSGPAVASVELLIGPGKWLLRDDFRQFISVDPGFSDGRLMAVVDWETVLAADLPVSSGESQLFAIAAELAGTDSGRPLADLVCGLDDRNLLRVLLTITRAHGRGNHLAATRLRNEPAQTEPGNRRSRQPTT
jgi:hypothetical protein